MKPSISHPALKFILQSLIIAAILILSSDHLLAQSTTDGQTPLGLKPGSPSGAYPLSDFETVNLFNGNLNFQMPLLTIGGRGSTSFPLTLHLDQKWTISKEVNPGHAAYHFGHSTWWSEDDGGNHTITAGRVRIRRGLLKNSGGVLKTLTRITFIAPDGTEYELRDQLTGGQPQGLGAGPYNRQKIFVTADGTAATYISDSDILDGYDYYDDEIAYPANGFLLLKDGTRFRIDDDKISWMRDRNGNKVSFNYDFYKRVTSVTDSLNRQVTITYDNVSGSETYDQINYKGFGGASRTVKVGHVAVGSVIRSDITPSSPLFSGLTGIDNANPPVVNYIELPDGRRYQFQYNEYAEIARIVLPTGGAIEYDWANGLTDGATSGLVQASYPDEWYVYRRVIERRLYAAGGSGAAFESRMTYSRPETTTTNLGYVVVDQYNSSATVLAHSVHYFHGSARASFAQKATDYAAWQDGKEYKTESYTANGSTLLRTVENTFEQRAAVSWWTGSSSTAPPNDVRPTETKTTLNDTNQVSTQIFGYDDAVPFNNQNNVKEYDFGSGTFGALVRETRTTFLTSATYTAGTSGSSVHIRTLPLQVSVHDGSGSEKSRTTFEYDNYTADSYHAALVSRSNVSGLCAAVVLAPAGCDNSNPSAIGIRGNPTATTQYLLLNGAVTGSVTTYAEYDILGNVIKTIDPRSTPANIIGTALEYDDRFGTPDGNARANSVPTELTGLNAFAFPTKVVNPLGHTVYTQLDYYLGKPVDGEDANGIVASGYYNDALDRPTQVQRAVGTTLENQTTFAYDDTDRVLTTTSDRDANNDNLLASKVFYDLMGRTIETRQYEGGTNYIAVQTQYDALGRAYKTSNPFRPWQSEVAIWTTQGFDDLGRVTSVTSPDSAVVANSYAGNAVTVADQTGKQRKSITDALGRLVQVYEDPNGLNYQTTYNYDVLDNLISVTQGTQTRTFVYDSLKRLTSATNPESGTVSYQYDNAGNLTQKTDARGVVSTYGYDSLNRNTSIAYTNDSSGTLPVTRVYDTATNGKGKLYQSQTTGSGGSLSTIDSYDALGRPLAQRQQFYLNGAWSSSYPTSRTYNLAGAVIGQTYPSGHIVTYNYDIAGRLADKDAQNLAFTGNLGDGLQRTYSAGILYSSLGGLVKEQFGTTTPVYNKLFYNSRGQLSEIDVSTNYTGPTDTNRNRGGIINHYSDDCSGMCGGSNSTTAMIDNNGNLKKQEVYIPNDEQGQSYTTRWQQYDYDSLNRLNWVREVNNSTEQWKQGFTYDRYGNRTINASITYGTGINNKLFSVNTSNNRLEVPSGQSGTMSYDNAGNLTNDTYSGYGQGVYDAENRMAWAQDSYGSWSYYTYNADGQRVRRKINNIETWAIYGMDGEMIAEYAANGATTTPQKEYGYRNGQLLVTAEVASGPLTPQNVTWTNAVGVTINGNSLTKTASDNWGNGGASSTQSFSSGDGYLEFTASETNTYRIIGLSSGDSNQDYTDIDFGAYLAGGSLCVYEAGTSRGCYGSFSTGDTIRVAVESGVVKYKKNGTVVYTSSVSPTYPLLADAAIWSNGGTIGNVVLTAPGGGGGGGSPSTQNVSWTSATGVNVSGNSLTKTAGDNWGNAGASSTQSFASGDGYVEVTASETTTYRMFGLSNGDSNQDYTDIDFAAYLAGSSLCVYEAGTNLGCFGSFSTGDTIRVAVESGVVKYKKNGTVIYSSSVTPNYPLLADSAIWSNGGTINNAVISGNLGGGGGSGSSGGVRWLVADQLGTPRMSFDESGSLANMTRHDYLPFGEELGAATGGRTTAQGYSASDGVRQQFTLKERDIETGLDYFGERYYASTQGRFTSVDPLGASAIVSDPQSFNRYTFVLNNPLKYIDPDGLDAKNPWDSLTDEERKRLASKFTSVKDASNPTAKELGAASQSFNKKVQVLNKDGSVNEKLTNSNIASVQNFAASLSGDSKVWNQIVSIDKVTSTGDGNQSDINFTVQDNKEFYTALKQTTDQFGNKRFFFTGTEPGLDHTYSAREIGYGTSDPSTHIGQDGPTITNLGVHWDNGSPLTYPTAGEVLKDWATAGTRRAIAGVKHFGNRASTSQVNQHLKNQGLTPLH